MRALCWLRPALLPSSAPFPSPPYSHLYPHSPPVPPPPPLSAVRCIKTDRTRILSAGDDKRLLVFDKATARMQADLRGHEDAVSAPPPTLWP